ncbi:hypothetical protein DO659_22135 [Salmonella enterica subsp. enterica serovar Minnesota]|nr:hypothetical protein [Salmonella enterica subsp. enterica serovar Minnesota]
MCIFTDINANKNLDGFLITGLGHSVSLFIRVNQINHGEQVPAKAPDLTPISGYRRPTRPGDIPPDYGRLGQ